MFNPKRYSRNWMCSRSCMKPRVGPSALELGFINSHIYFHTLVDIKNWPSAICIPSPSCSTPRRYSRNLKWSRHCMKPTVKSQDNKNMRILKGILDILSRDMIAELAVCFTAVYNYIVQFLSWFINIFGQLADFFLHVRIKSTYHAIKLDICEIKRMNAPLITLGNVNNYEKNRCL